MLTIKPGRCLAPFSSANTNLTRTTSPRLQLVIRGILWIVPKCRQHGISAFIEGDQIGSRELVDQIVFQASLNGFPDVLTNGLVALGCGDVNSSPGLTRNVNAKPRSSLVHSRHLRSIPIQPHWHTYVNVSTYRWLDGLKIAALRPPRACTRTTFHRST